MKKVIGVILLLAGIAWGLWVFFTRTEGADPSVSYMIGALTLPVLLSLIGLWLAKR